MRSIAVLVGLAVPGASCGDGAEPAESEELRLEGDAVTSDLVPSAALEQARATANELTGELGGLLMRTLQEEGPLAAMEICSDTAQAMTAGHASEGVYVRRVSERPRNPANTPDAAEAVELQRLAAGHQRGELPSEVVRVVRRGDERTLHYLRPISIAPPCVTCHGPVEQIPAEVRGVLENRYPDDQATGYEAGDFRGAVSVRVGLDAD